MRRPDRARARRPPGLDNPSRVRTMLPILLIHAAGGAARNFGSVLRRLPAARAIDLPGHGRAGGEAPRSIDESARFALASAPPGELLVGGHSMGGAVALTVAT